MSKIARTIDVYDGEWTTYDIDEIDDYFHFVEKPNWNEVKEMFLGGMGQNRTLEIVFKEGYNNNEYKHYNSVYGTFVEVNYR